MSLRWGGLPKGRWVFLAPRLTPTACPHYHASGASVSNVDHYPELQSIVYSQWFAYMHAIWDEQFRQRIAAFFSTPEQPLEKNDVVNDFFGDIRLIRNDFVHRKGIADEATKVKRLNWGFVKDKPLDITTEQMLSLADLFREMR